MFYFAGQRSPFNDKRRDAAEDLRDGVKEAAKDLKAPSKDSK